MSAARRAAALPRVSFAERTDSDADSDGGPPRQRQRRAAAALSDDDLEIVAGGAGGSATKRKPRKDKGAKRAVKKRKSGGGDGEDGAEEGTSASRLVNSLSSRYKYDEAAPAFMSSVARRETSEHLNYFEQLAQPARKSASNLNDLQPLSPEERERIAAALPLRHEAEQMRLRAHLLREMREWYVSLTLGGANVLCYGYGSKKRLLNDFARTWLTDGPVIVFNGYTPGTHVKSILNALTRSLMHLENETFRDLPAHIERIRDWFRKDALQAQAGGRRGLRLAQAAARLHGHEVVYSSDEEYEDAEKRRPFSHAAASSASAAASRALLPHVYLVIHNIDGASVRDPRQQHALAQLASIPQIRLIASVDHIRSGLLWDRAMLASFNFTARDCTTFVDYSLEHAANASAVGAEGGSSGGGFVQSEMSGRAAGITNVLSSLTPNHRKVLDVLAREQLTPNNPNFIRPGLVERAKLYTLCEESMLVSSGDSFTRLMNELLDHRLVEERVVDRTRTLTIPYSTLVIRREILGEKPENDDAMLAQAAAQAAQDAERQAAARDSARGGAFGIALGVGGGAEDEEEADEEEEMAMGFDDDEDGQ